MPTIPLHQPGGVQAQINFPRPVAKGALIANLGTQALAVTGELEKVIYKDRERRDYNEQLIAAQNALNFRSTEALVSNDPRTMLENFNRGWQEDSDAIRAKIQNPKLVDDFLYRTNAGVNNARRIILGQQLKLERQESSAQRDALATSLFDSAMVDTSSDNMLIIRDSLQNATEQAIETHDMTTTQASNWNREIIGQIELGVIHSLVQKDMHEEAKERISNGEFASLSPGVATKLLEQIHLHEQDSNYTDWDVTLENGGASYAAGEKILRDRRIGAINERQTRSLYSKNKRLVAKKLVDTSARDWIAAAYSDQFSGIGVDPTSPFLQKGVEAFTESTLDKKHRDMGLVGENLFTARATDVKKMSGMMSDHWKWQAVAAVDAGMEAPEVAVAAAGMLEQGYSGDKAFRGELNDSHNGIMGKVDLINRFRVMGMKPRANLLEVEKRWQMRNDSDAAENGRILTARIEKDPQLIHRAFTKAFYEDSTEHSEFGMKTYSEVTSVIGWREDSQPTKGGMFGGAMMNAMFGNKQGINEVEGKLVFTSPDRGIWAKLAHLTKGEMSSIYMPGEGMMAFNDLLEHEFMTNGGNLDQAGAAAFKQWSVIYSPTAFGGDPRFARGAVERHQRPINGTWEWAENDIKAMVQNRVLEYFESDPRTMGSLVPDLRNLNDLPEWMSTVGDLLAGRAMDADGVPLLGDTIPQAYKEIGIRMLGSIMDAGGDPTQWYTGLFHKMFTDDGPNVRLITNPELEQYKPDPENRPEWTEIGYYIEYQTKDGAWEPIYALPGFGDIYEIYYFDRDATPEGAEQKHKEDEFMLRSLLRNMVQLSADETTMTAELKKLGLGEFSLDRTVDIHDTDDYLQLLGQAGFNPRGIPKAVEPRLHLTKPDFNYEQWLEDNPR
jgi:hypothetical protein